MKHEEVHDLLMQALRLYRSSLELKEQEKAGETFSIPDLRLRHLAIAERNLELVLRAVRMERAKP